MQDKIAKTDYSKLTYIFDTDARESAALDRIFKTVKAEEKYGRDIIGNTYDQSIPSTSRYLILSRVLGYAYGLYPLPEVIRAGETLDSVFYCAGLALRNADKIKAVFDVAIAQDYQDLDGIR
jgi:hypothetical protein